MATAAACHVSGEGHGHGCHVHTSVRMLCTILNFFPPNEGSIYVLGSISTILNFFPPNRGVDFYFEFLPAKSRSRFLCHPAVKLDLAVLQPCYNVADNVIRYYS